jgi:hypothetical protein
MSITFVTCYIKIYNEDYNPLRTFEKRLEFFLKLVETGINICIFCSPEFKEQFEEICEKNKNIKLIDIYTCDDLQFLKINNSITNLPEIRNKGKDTEYYMYLMNSKIDFVKKTIDINPFSSEHFAWIDFNIPYIFKNVDKTIQDIKIMSQRNYNHSFLTMPGCWHFKVNDINYIKSKICWRFCGGFFLGDKVSLIEFYKLSCENFNEFLMQTNTLVWEVNYWTWLETNKNFKPIWYESDHNDSIINIPECVIFNNIIN